MKYINLSAIGRIVFAVVTTLSVSAATINNIQLQDKVTARSIRPDRPSGTSVAIPVNTKIQNGQFDSLTVNGDAKILGKLLVCGGFPQIETCIEQLLSCCEFLTSLIEVPQPQVTPSFVAAAMCCRSVCITFPTLAAADNDFVINQKLSPYLFFGAPNTACMANCGSNLIAQTSVPHPLVGAPNGIFLAEQPNTSGAGGTPFNVNPTGGVLQVVFPCDATLDSVSVAALNNGDVIGPVTVTVLDNMFNTINVIVTNIPGSTGDIAVNTPNARSFRLQVASQTGITGFCITCPDVGIDALSCCERLTSIIESLNTCCPRSFCIDFQKFNVGDTTTTINAGLVGITLSATSSCGNGLIVFDSSNPGTGNESLGSPNQDCSLTDCPAGCPGIGSGGAPTGMCPNCAPLGKVLILSDNGTLNPCIFGGTITLTFTCPVIFEQIGLLNVDSDGNTLEFFDSKGSVITTQPITNCCPNGYQVVTSNVSGVKSVNINLNTNAAITHFCFRCEVVDESARSCCEALSSILEVIETRIENLESCCEQNSREISILDVCCEQSQSCCERVTSLVDNIEREISLLDLCCLANLSCCESLQSQIDVLNCPSCCPRQFCLAFNQFAEGTGVGVINTNPRFCGVTVSSSPAGSVLNVNAADCALSGTLSGCFNGVVPTRAFGIPSDVTCEPGAGTVTFTFACPVVIDNVGIVNYDLDNLGSIQLLDSNGNEIKTVPVPNLTDQTFQDVVINQTGVKTVNIIFGKEGGAVACLCFHCEVVDQSARSCCDNHETRIDNLESCCDQVRSILDIIETRIESLESCCDESRRCCSAFELIINNFISEFDSFETRIENLESCCEQNKTAIDNLVSCCDNHETRIENLESCCERVSSIIDRLLCQDCCPVQFCINFDQFVPGDTQSAINAKLCGVVIAGSGNNCEGPNPCGPMIYDSTSFSGLNAANLGTPNTQNGGPGQEENGFNTNTASQGNVLIISDGSGAIAANNDGGTLVFTFTCPVVVDEIGILDIDAEDDEPAGINLFDSNGNQIGATIPIPGLHDNSFQIVHIGVAGVKRMEVFYAGLAAITNICFHCEVIDIAARSCCDFVSSVVEVQKTQIDNLISCCDNHETRIEALESCCDSVTSRVDKLENQVSILDACCQNQCIKCYDFYGLTSTTANATTSQIFTKIGQNGPPPTPPALPNNASFGGNELSIYNTDGSMVGMNDYPNVWTCNTATANMYICAQPPYPQFLVRVKTDGNCQNASCLSVKTYVSMNSLPCAPRALNPERNSCENLTDFTNFTMYIWNNKTGAWQTMVNRDDFPDTHLCAGNPEPVVPFIPVTAFVGPNVCDYVDADGFVAFFLTTSMACPELDFTCFQVCLSCLPCPETGEPFAHSCCEQLTSLADNHETRIEALETCCDEVRSRLDALECPPCCPKQFCVDFAKFDLGTSQSVVNAALCGVTLNASGVSDPTATHGVGTTLNAPVQLSCSSASTNHIFGNFKSTPPLSSLGGDVTITFTCPVVLENVGIFFNESASIELLAADGGLIKPIINVSGGGSQTVTINTPGVAQAIIHFGQNSGGLYCFCYHCEVVDLAARSCCDSHETRIENLESCCDEVRSKIDVINRILSPFGELVFTANDMTTIGGSYSPTASPVNSSALATLYLTALLPLPNPTGLTNVPGITVAFGLPEDVNPAGPMEIDVHFFTAESPSVSGNININLKAQFLADGVEISRINGDTFPSSNTVIGTGISNSSINNIKHYKITVSVNPPLGSPQEWALLALSRVDAELDTFMANIYISSLVFRYQKLV